MEITCRAEEDEITLRSVPGGDPDTIVTPPTERVRMGADGMPIVVPRGCGRTFPITDDRSRWDVNTTIIEGGQELITERHVAPICPYCGTVADHVSEAVEPAEPFMPEFWQVASIAKREELLTKALTEELTDEEATWMRRH